VILAALAVAQSLESAAPPAAQPALAPAPVLAPTTASAPESIPVPSVTPTNASANAADSAQASGLSGADALKPFFRRLDAARTPDSPPIVVLQIGDSHSAADHISGALRARLQAKFGEGGRGVLPPGRPYKVWSARQIEMSQSDGWRNQAQFLIPSLIAAAQGDPSAASLGPGPYGLAGQRLTSTRPGARLTLQADPQGGFDQVVVCGMAGKDRGDLMAVTDGVSRRIDISSPGAEPVCRSLDLPAPASNLELIAEGGPVSLLSVATFRKGGGVSLSNLGVIGARIDELAARDDRALAAELAAYRPALILLAFGTNDGFQAHVDGEAYRMLFQGQLQRLKRMAPDAAILVMAPPDANTSRPDIALDGVHNAGFDCAALTPAEVGDYDELVAEKSPRLARWYPPPSLDVVRQAERRAAEAEGAAFWDWQQREGGPCSAHRLAHAYNQLVRGDHVHFNSEGGDMVAGLLFQDLASADQAQGAH
jgi:lysophospholipase L1-like esterase